MNGNMNEKPKHLDLFSGIGGFALAAKWAAFETVGFCERDKFCQKVLRKHWPDIPIHEDIKNLDGTKYEGIELLTGGFPCQPFSVAGKQRGKEDDRYLWPQMLRVIKEARPAWVIGENVAGFVNMALDEVLFDLESEGYTSIPFIIPACAVNAPHRRDRVWIVGNSKHTGFDATEVTRGIAQRSYCDSERQAQASQLEGSGSKHENVADTESFHAQGQRKKQRQRKPWRSSWWTVEPEVGRVAHGIPSRVDRLKGLGNAIVPQVAYEILKKIKLVL